MPAVRVPLSLTEVFNADKPTPPGGPLKVEDVRAQHATVKWKKPEDNGGSDITGYVIEKMDMDTGRWVPAGEVGPDADSFKVTGLNKGKKYKLRVKAINKEGESEPLETTDSFIAKNPYGKDMTDSAGTSNLYFLSNNSTVPNKMTSCAMS